MLQKKRWSVLFAVLFIVGIILLSYSTVSNEWNSVRQTKIIATYSEQVAKMKAADYTDLFRAAAEYNARLSEKEGLYELSPSDRAKYLSMLCVGDDELLGYIDIPSIGCTLPIYHGTEEKHLQIGVGHLEWSDLPIGGSGTHCILSGHRGLPQAKLFTSLDKLSEGDTFTLRVLDRTFCYEVDKISIVLPDDMRELARVEGKDYCTLVTCTPYGVNSHRLLVRGHRIDAAAQADIRVVGNATQVEPLIIAIYIAVPLLILAVIVVLLRDRRKAKARRRLSDLPPDEEF